jgi:hypothetical protein
MSRTCRLTAVVFANDIVEVEGTFYAPPKR